VSVRLVPFKTEREEVADGSLRMRAHGELDLATASALDEDLIDCDLNQPWHLVVDLSDVPFIDAAGLRVLIRARERLESSGGELLIASPSRQVARLLEVAGKSTGLRVVATTAEPRRAA
jgi:anti-sigma B factor antagonist